MNVLTATPKELHQVRSSPALLPQKPLTLKEFLVYSGWGPVHSERGMTEALNFFQSHVKHSDLRKLETDPHAWALPENAPITKPELQSPKTAQYPTLGLTQLMQAIDFREPVQPVRLEPGQTYKAFVTRNRYWQGRYYTFLSGKAETAAIPERQDVPVLYKVTKHEMALKSRIADAYVDWSRQEREKIDWNDPAYRRGGGQQLFVANPWTVLRKM